MNRQIYALALVFSLATANAQNMPMPKADGSHAGHEVMKMPAMQQPKSDETPQPATRSDQAEYEPYDMVSMGPAFFWHFLLDQLEYGDHEGEDFLSWEAEAWYGGDFNRFWLKTEGEQTLQGPGSGAAEIHGYYSRLVTPFWEAQAGIRFDTSWGGFSNSSRFFLAIGLQGHAPYNFEMTPVLFLSEDGDLSARVTTSKDYRITQRLIAQPRFETEIAAQDVPELSVGSGVNYVEFGLRLRYEIRREFSPYIGVNWERKLGRTANASRAKGESPNILSVVAGLRIWF